MTLKAITRATAITVAVALVLFGGVVFVIDWREVRPLLPEIRSSLDTFPAEDRNVPSNVASVIWKLDRQHAVHVDMQVAQSLLVQSLPMKMGMWHVRSVVWSVLLPIHLDQQTRTALYSHNLMYEKGRGLSSAAEYYFHKQPHALTIENVAGLMAIDRSPNGNSPTRHPDRYATTTARLLDAYRTP